MKREKVAIYVDYTLRIPSFNTAYEMLKQLMFQDREELDTEGDTLILDFWGTEIKRKEVEEFYFKTKVTHTDYELRDKDLQQYFFNKDHYLKFIEDYSYNLYVDCLTPSTKDVDLINIAQKYLFDIYFIDEYSINRKKINTMFFLSKLRTYIKGLIFLHEEDTLDESEFLAVWNPKKNPEQENDKELGVFENWLKELEQKIRKDGNEQD